MDEELTTTEVGGAYLVRPREGHHGSHWLWDRHGRAGPGLGEEHTFNPVVHRRKE